MALGEFGIIRLFVL